MLQEKPDIVIHNQHRKDHRSRNKIFSRTRQNVKNPALVEKFCSGKVKLIHLHLSIYLSLTITFKQFEKISKALGDSNRLKILHFLSNKGGCGQCSDIPSVVDLAQPSISHHVKILVESGLIEPEKEGRNHKYTINNSMLDLYIEMIADLKT